MHTSKQIMLDIDWQARQMLKDTDWLQLSCNNGVLSHKQHRNNNVCVLSPEKDSHYKNKVFITGSPVNIKIHRSKKIPILHASRSLKRRDIKTWEKNR